MGITISLIDESCISSGKKFIIVEVEGPVTIRDLYELAQIQEGINTLKKELESMTVVYEGKMLDYKKALDKVILPGEEILLLPIMEGG